MLAKRITTPTVFSGALTLAALSGCSLQDYDALGAGNKTDERTEDTDETTTDSDSSDARTSTAPESTDEPDASVPTDTDTSDTSATEETSTETSSSSTTTGTSSTSESAVTTDTSSTSEEGTSELPPPPPPIVTEGNLIANSSFESPVAAGAMPGQWQQIGSAFGVVSTEFSHTGIRSWQTSGRTENWEGPGINMLGLLDHSHSYFGRAWVRGSAASTFKFMMKSVCIFEGGIEPEDPTTRPLIYQQLGATVSSGTEWVMVETSPFVLRDCQLNTLVFYFDGPQPGVSLFLDDISIVPVAD